MDKEALKTAEALKTIIGQRIFQAREKRGTFQEELAEYLGVTKGCISSWEKSRTLPDVITLREIARFFAVDIKYFFGEENIDEKEKCTCDLTTKELRILNKIRTSPPKKRNAIEVLLEIDN